MIPKRRWGQANLRSKQSKQSIYLDLVADEGAVVEGDAVRELLVREHDISRGHAHLHLVRG